MIQEVTPKGKIINLAGLGFLGRVDLFKAVVGALNKEDLNFTTNPNFQYRMDFTPAVSGATIKQADSSIMLITRLQYTENQLKPLLDIGVNVLVIDSIPTLLSNLYANDKHNIDCGIELLELYSKRQGLTKPSGTIVLNPDAELAISIESATIISDRDWYVHTLCKYEPFKENWSIVGIPVSYDTPTLVSQIVSRIKEML